MELYGHWDILFEDLWDFTDSKSGSVLYFENIAIILLELLMLRRTETKEFLVHGSFMVKLPREVREQNRKKESLSRILCIRLAVYYASDRCIILCIRQTLLFTCLFCTRHHYQLYDPSYVLCLSSLSLSTSVLLYSFQIGHILTSWEREYKLFVKSFSGIKHLPYTKAVGVKHSITQASSVWGKAHPLAHGGVLSCGQRQAVWDS